MILDTNAVSALFAGEESLGELLDAETHHHLPTIVLGEYRYGLMRSRKRDHLELLLETLARESVVLAVDDETARHYANVREELRERGLPIPENDVWIAALARQHDLAVVSRDEHFDRVSGLLRRSW